MEQLKIEEISLADFRIKEVSFRQDYKEINIISEGSIRISDLIRFKETLIKIKNWKKLSVSKYVIKEPFAKGDYIEIDWRNNLETFDFIQEITLKNEIILILNGFSKESGAWLTYEFVEFEYEIIVK